MMATVIRRRLLSRPPNGGAPAPVPHVCVVGAGMSGLRCAEVLLKNGFRVTILEGRDRIGGRIHQTLHAGRLIDLGASWIHGTVNNPILELARRDPGTVLHVLGEDDDAYPLTFDADGRPLEPAEATKLSQQMWGVIAAALQHSTEHGDAIPPDASLMDFFRASLDELFPLSEDGDGDGDGGSEDYCKDVDKNRNDNDNSSSSDNGKQGDGGNDSAVTATRSAQTVLKHGGTSSASYNTEDAAKGGGGISSSAPAPAPASTPALAPAPTPAPAAVSVAEQRQRLLWMAEFFSAIIGDPVARQSLKFFWLEDGIAGDNLFVVNTYKRILDTVAALPLEKATVLFNKKVTAIRAPDKDVSDEQDDDSSSSNSTVTVTTADGATQQFDEVVVTAPLGWLKRNKAAFTPPLPARLSEAIDAISYGTLEKVYITFPRAFWEEGDDAPPATAAAAAAAAATADHPPLDAGANADADAGPTSPAPRRPPPVTMSWMHPRYAPDTNPDCWSQGALSLTALPAAPLAPEEIEAAEKEAAAAAAAAATTTTTGAVPGDAPSSSSGDASHETGGTSSPSPSSPSSSSTSSSARATLLFFTYGPFSRHLTAQLARTPPAAHAALLTRLFAPYYARLPRYDPAQRDCVPIALRATAWSADELAGFGSYSNFQVGLTAAAADLAALRAGAPARRVWLAGEHAAPPIATGTVSGAYWAGEAVAQRIVERAYGRRRADPSTLVDEDQR